MSKNNNLNSIKGAATAPKTVAKQEAKPANNKKAKPGERNYTFFYLGKDPKTFEERKQNPFQTYEKAYTSYANSLSKDPFMLVMLAVYEVEGKQAATKLYEKLVAATRKEADDEVLIERLTVLKGVKAAVEDEAEKFLSWKEEQANPSKEETKRDRKITAERIAAYVAAKKANDAAKEAAEEAAMQMELRRIDAAFKAYKAASADGSLDKHMSKFRKEQMYGLRQEKRQKAYAKKVQREISYHERKAEAAERSKERRMNAATKEAMKYLALRAEKEEDDADKKNRR